MNRKFKENYHAPAIEEMEMRVEQGIAQSGDVVGNSTESVVGYTEDTTYESDSSFWQ